MASRAPAPRWRRRKDARPAEIVAAALEAFAERGFTATRLEDVAERAGVSKGTLYLYFRNKEELFKAVVRHAMLPSLELAEARLAASTGSMEQILREIAGGLVGAIAGTRMGAIPKLIIAEAGNFPDLAQFYVDEVITRAFRLMNAIVTRGVARGELRNIDRNLLPPVIAGPILLLALWKNVLEPYSQAKIDPAHFLETYLDVLLNGLLRKPEGT